MPHIPARASLPVRSTANVQPPAYTQGIYWIVTGIWPLLHRRSFEWVTGPKADFWLVELVGLLLAVFGATMVLARVRQRITPEVGFMAMAATVVVTLVSVYYVSRERIEPTYLIDVGIEVIFLAGWLRWLIWRPRHSPVPAPSGAPVVPPNR